MRTIKIYCDCCKKEISGNEFIEISADENLKILNNLPDRKLISMQHHTEIHFCSSKCMMDKFFKTDPENYEPDRI